ncbi:hypothetical protein ACN267_22750 [Micromonospora sp. WMMD734]|uniref:hypothetical protein n=1 Tax=Micromonospora sp. WMMD734 TaxID=3404129 RepID=UPI003B9319B6
MTAVVWTEKSGDLIETVAAVTVCRRHPSAERVRASVGDGGIDIRVRNGDGWTVFQVKGYTGNMTASRKSKVEHSFKRVQEYAAEVGMKIAEWNLLVPIDPTKENLVWFEELTKGAPFACGWKGRAYLDGLAAEFPDVIEYYFGDGAERLAETVRQVAAATGTLVAAERASSSAPITADGVRSGLSQLYEALNKFDPHYRYAFSVSPSLPEFPGSYKPGLVFTHAEGKEGCFVTFDVYARYAEAVRDSPITIQGVLSAPAGTDEAKALEEFHRYGAHFSRLDLGSGFVISAPGGLGGELDAGTFTVGPTVEDLAVPPRPIRLQVIDPADVVLAEVEVFLKKPTYGLGGQGMSVQAADASGFLMLRFQVDLETRAGKFDLELGDASGLHPSAILPALRVVDAMHEPNRVRLANQYGPPGNSVIEIAAPREEQENGILRLVEALQELQQHTVVQVAVPSLSELSRLDALRIIRAAAILRGEEVHVQYRGYSLVFDQDAQLEDGDHAGITGVEPLVLLLNQQPVQLGWRRFFAHEVKTTRTSRDDGKVEYRLTPSAGESFLMRFVAGEPPTESNSSE